jgi:hypothetical protein
MPGGHPADLIPIVQRAYDLCVGLYAHVNRFPRAQRTLLGHEQDVGPTSDAEPSLLHALDQGGDDRHIHGEQQDPAVR